jgi:ribosomal protein S18 acetylase RimI-like enzyme
VYPDGTGTIASLSVHPEYRGRGIGQALLQASVGYLQKRGAHAAVLYVDNRNETAQRLYLQAGFECIDPTG